MSLLEDIKLEMNCIPKGEFCAGYFRANGYQTVTNESFVLARAIATESLFCEPTPFIYQSDLIAGSIRPLFVELTDQQRVNIKEILAKYPERSFLTNNDHFSPDYEGTLELGISGLLEKIDRSRANHAQNSDSLELLDAMRISLNALQKRILLHEKRAKELIGAKGYDKSRLEFIAENCKAVANGKPKTFAQALQLVWMIHTSFVFEGRYAMALGRLDQYLYPFYKRDLATGILSYDGAVELLENTLVKICERRFYLRSDDVVNVCIAGVDKNGDSATNELSFAVLQAVKNINMPGPNLSARIAPSTPDKFLDECLKSIGTGLGYPALMNDTVNMAALLRYGYDEQDVRNYSMVGCIENFITGMQPPWSDGRFDAPRYIEYLMLDGQDHGSLPLDKIDTMQQFMKELEKLLAIGAKEYVEWFQRRNTLADPSLYTCAFLSCFCKDCIEKARDINMGGSKYPSVHGVGLMGVGTMSDSLAAIEKVVFCDRQATLAEVAQAMRCNFEGYKDLHQKLLDAPKYGNNDDFVDKYAVWFTSYLSDLFGAYRTRDGGGIYTAMAANTSNISAGKNIGATPDGRLAGEPLSDAASATYGRDKKGATSALLSLSKPDYTRCACGTVVNQKYSPSIFADGKRKKLLDLIRVYFARGGQQIQINATSTDILKDAMEHPERYSSLVVRVSGFSALYVTLRREVQEDILRRTQQE